jgi:hypothetical protein
VNFAESFSLTQDRAGLSTAEQMTSSDAMQQGRIPHYDGQFRDKMNSYIRIRTALFWVNSPEERSSRLLRCGSLKSRTVHRDCCIV